MTVMLNVLFILHLTSLLSCLTSPEESASGRSYDSGTINNGLNTFSVHYDRPNYPNHNYDNENKFTSSNYNNENRANVVSNYDSISSSTGNSDGKTTQTQASKDYVGIPYAIPPKFKVADFASNINYGMISQIPSADYNNDNRYTLVQQNQAVDLNRDNYAISPHIQVGSPVYKANQMYNQPDEYYSYPSGVVQERFHPHGHVHHPDVDTHTGEVVQPPLQPAASQNFASVVKPSVPNGFLTSANSFSSFPADFVPQASETLIQSEAPSIEPSLLESTPPALPSGYDYHPPPTTLPPEQVATPYYYYPPANSYLPVPTQPPSNQYLPVPSPPPNHYLPAPIPQPAAAPEEERQVDYTYYYLGPKLWYVPLFFSIYFVLYVGALIIKAISKHKILFPQQLYNAATSVYQGREASLDILVDRVNRALATQTLKYFQRNTLGKEFKGWKS